MRAQLRHAPALCPQDKPVAPASAAYNEAGDKYLAYADGDPRELFAFDGQYSYGDRCLWNVLDSMLVALRQSGAQSIRLLDAGCGPGTWLRRIVTRARALGFTRIRARGFDVAQAQIRKAMQLTQGLRDITGVDLAFSVADIALPMPEADRSVDLTLCLYGVLNHLQPSALSRALGEIGRITAGHFVTTVRAAGSQPTIYVDGIEQARRFRLDHRTDVLDVELDDSRRFTFRSRLFTSRELRDAVDRHMNVEALRGLDLFHARFAHDPRWNPSWLQDNSDFIRELDRLERKYESNPDFIDRATHLLLVARGR